MGVSENPITLCKQAERSGAQGSARLGQARPRLVRIIVSSIPWLVIAGLLWAGFFIKPQPVGSTVQPPIVEARDHYYGIAAFDNHQLWLAGSNGKIVAVHRDGTLTRLKTPTAHTLQDIAAWDARRAVAVGNDGVVLVSADGGASWQEVKDVPKSAVANKLTKVRVLQNGKAWAVGEMGALLYSSDHGQVWARARSEEDVAWNDIALTEEGTGWVVGEFGRMLKSRDGGKSWEPVQAPVKSSLMSVAFRDARNGVVVGLEGVVLVTTNGGATWVQAYPKVREHLFDIAWDEARRRWVAGGNLGVWVTGDASATNWEAGKLDARDLAWHTRILPNADGVWFVGANVGIWSDGRWVPLSERVRSKNAPGVS